MEKHKPLWRKVNKDRRISDCDSKYDKNRKRGVNRSMASKRNGRCFKPLYHFLLSSVGRNFNDVYSVIKLRLEACDIDRVYDIISLKSDITEIEPTVKVGRNSIYSTLYIDADNILRVAHPDVCNEQIYPSCTCCTHTFNGKELIQKYPKWYLTIINRYE
ncbi:MAG: hypothetical protein ACRDD8_03955 [Bacteroidales bacterium]